MKKPSIHEELHFLASRIRFTTDRECIAEAIDLIAVALTPCEDCGAPEPMPEIPEAVLVPDLLSVIDELDLPDVGQLTDIHGAV